MNKNYLIAIITFIITLLDNTDLDFIPMTTYVISLLADACAIVGHDVLSNMISANYVNESKNELSRMLCEDVVYAMKKEGVC